MTTTTLTSPRPPALPAQRLAPRPPAHRAVGLDTDEAILAADVEAMDFRGQLPKHGRHCDCCRVVDHAWSALRVEVPFLAWLEDGEPQAAAVQARLRAASQAALVAGGGR